jgi:hypothetical protein
VSKTVTVAAQIEVDEDNRARQDYPADGYAFVDPTEFQLQDDVYIGPSGSKILWAYDSGDLAEWKLLYVEAINSPLKLTLSTVDGIEVAATPVEVTLYPGAPFMLARRTLPTAPATYVSQVQVEDTVGGEARARFSFAR